MAVVSENQLAKIMDHILAWGMSHVPWAEAFENDIPLSEQEAREVDDMLVWASDPSRVGQWRFDENDWLPIARQLLKEWRERTGE
ncbi:MAG: hypothetical protein RIC55_07935 [Pirellulaceae bacterium]